MFTRNISTFICYQIKQKHCIFFSAKTFVYERRLRPWLRRRPGRLGEVTTLPDLVGWGGGYPLPYRHSVDAFIGSFQ